jgi:hypothetical protein
VAVFDGRVTGLERDLPPPGPVARPGGLHRDTTPHAPVRFTALRETSSRHVDELLNERLAHRGRRPAAMTTSVTTEGAGFP